MQLKKHNSWFDHLAVNLFWLGLNIRNNAVGSLFLPYLVDVFVRPEIKNTALGLLRFAGLIVAMMVQPAAGIISDRSTSRFGRRRPFIFIGVILDLVFLAALYFAWDYASLVIALLLLQFSSNISHGPLQALIPDMIPEDQRGVASGLKSIFELLPLILVGFTIAGLVSRGHLDWAFLATGAALLVIMLLTVIFVREKPLLQRPAIPLRPAMLRVTGMLAAIIAGALGGILIGAVFGGLIGMAAWPLLGSCAARMIGVSLGGLTAMVGAVYLGVRAGILVTLGSKMNRGQPASVTSFPWWVINRLLFLAAITSIQGFAPYFLMYAFRINRDLATGMTGQLMTMVGLFTLLTALPGGWFSDRFGYKPVIAVSGLGAAAGSFLLLATIWFPSMTLLYAIGAILGLSTGLFVTANWALGTKLIPPEEAGRYLGVSNLAGAGAGIIGQTMGGPIADYLNGMIPGSGYFVLFACYGVLFLLSIASLRGISITVPAVQTQPGLPAPLD